MDRIRAGCDVDGPVIGARRCDEILEGVAPRRLRSERWPLGRTGNVDAEPLTETPEGNTDRT